MKEFLNTKNSIGLIKQFMKEKSGNVILEFLVLLCVFGVAVATISPVVKEKLSDMYDVQSKNITFGGERTDDALTQTPQSNTFPVVSPEVITPQPNYVFKFDGSTYVQLPETLNRFGSSDFTFEGWFEIEAPAGQSVDIFAKNGKTAENELIFGVWSDKYHINPGPTVGNEKSSSVIAKRGQKVHLAWVMNNNQLSVYENGSLVWTVTVSPRTPFTDEAPAKLGMDTDYGLTVPSDFYKGYMYEVRLYDRPLTQSEVVANMNGNTKRDSSLLAEYLFNEGAGDVIIDHSGKQNNAIIIGNPTWVKK